MIIVNLTQHQPTAEQADVVNLTPGGQALLRSLLNFDGDEPPSPELVASRAFQIVSCMLDNLPPGIGVVRAAMIGGAPFLMKALHEALVEMMIEPVYSYSKRVSTEVLDAQGMLVKTSVFKHVGWVRPT